MTAKLLTALMIVITSISSVLTGTAAPIDSAADLANARVPSLCDHPAGRLRDGVLPGIPEGEGVVSLRNDRVAIGGFLPRGQGHAAAVLACSRGGVGWTENVVFYNRRGRIVGHVELSEVTRGGRERVHRIWIRNRRVHVQVTNIHQDGDPICCGTASAKLVYRWDRQSRAMELVQQRTFNEHQAANDLIAAFNAGNAARAARFASGDVIDEFFQWQGTPVRVIRCIRPTFLERTRECTATPVEPRAVLFVFGMDQVSWNQWIAADYEWIHTE
ncbi:MAG: hypothetical protein ACE367_03220 [Acidimicrobiales bacterium]